MKHLSRICAKLFAEGAPSTIDHSLVPVYHRWIREKQSEEIYIDVADYTHVPESPGVMLVTHDVAYSFDRSDGHAGLLAQRRFHTDKPTAEVIAETLRRLLTVAERLQGEPSLSRVLNFDGRRLRVESNDRLRAPNSWGGYAGFEPHVRTAIAEVFPGRAADLSRTLNDGRERLACDVYLR